MKRVVIVAASLEILGGHGVQAALLIDALRGEGADARLLPIDARLPRWLRRLPYARTIANQAKYLPSLASLRHADVVQVFSASYWSFLLAPVPAMLAARLFGKRLVLHYHSGEAADHLARWGVLVHPWLRLAHEIVVPSEYLRGVFAAHGYKTKVIPNIVDLSQFRFRERRPVHPRLLSLRNLEPYYRVDTVLHAFAAVRRRRGDATLTVAGYGGEEARLKALADELGVASSVRFVGRTEPAGVPALFDESDIFVNASVLDNQPVSLLEAFAAGTPVVSTPAGDIPAMVADRVSGRLVPMNNPGAMADAVLGLIEDPDGARAMARAAHESLEKFTWQSVRSQWSNIYDGVPHPAASVEAVEPVTDRPCNEPECA
jgi:glycosyltransferase involved in cell wall biosynthesis